MFKVSFCFPSSLQNGNHHLAPDAWSQENGEKQSPQLEAKCLSTWSDREHFQQNQLHLRNLVWGAWKLFFMLACKLLQALEPAHPLSAGMISPRQERTVLWHVHSPKPGYKCQGIVIKVKWLQVLLSSQAWQRECFSSLSCQILARTPNQSSSPKMSQSM